LTQTTHLNNVNFLVNFIKILLFKMRAALKNRRLLVIILTERLGDLVAAQAVLKGIANQDEDIFWAVQKPYSDVVMFNPAIKSVIPVISYKEAMHLRHFLHGIRWLDLHVDGWQCSTYATIAQNANSAGINSRNYYNYGSLSDVFSLIGTGHKAEGPPVIHADPNFNADLYLSKAFVDPKLPLLILHLTSDEACRSWPADCSRELAAWLLQSTAMNVIEFGLTPVLNSNSRILQPRDTISLGQQMALVARGNLFIGVDSGFSHLANAFGVPSIFLIGRYRDFSTHLPWHLGPQDTVLRSEQDAYNIPLEDVERAVELKIKELGFKK